MDPTGERRNGENYFVVKVSDPTMGPSSRWRHVHGSAFDALKEVDEARKHGFIATTQVVRNWKERVRDDQTAIRRRSQDRVGEHEEGVEAHREESPEVPDDWTGGGGA